MGKLPHVSRYASRKGSPHDELSQSKSLEVGVSVSRGLHPEISEEGDLRVARRHLGGVLRELARQRESEVEEGHLLADHVHMMVSIPPKYSVAQVIGYMKGKSAIHIAREFAGRSRLALATALFMTVWRPSTCSAENSCGIRQG